jgi:hypothetical protein
MPAQTREGVAGKPKRVPRVWGADQQMDPHRVARGKSDQEGPAGRPEEGNLVDLPKLDGFLVSRNIGAGDDRQGLQRGDHRAQVIVKAKV